MRNKNQVPDFLRIVMFPQLSKLPIYAIQDSYGKISYVYNAATLRFVAEKLRIPFKIVKPTESSFGSKMSDGNWTGFIGMAKRSEVDLVGTSVALTEERYEDVNFSYPYGFSKVTFKTDALKPMAKSFAIFYPFTHEMWVALVILLFAMAVCFYVLSKGKTSYQNVFFKMAGSFLEQSTNFKTKTTAFKLLLVTWFLGVMIIADCYKALLLSFLSFPTMTGIQHIPDLAKASREEAFKCFTYRGGHLTRSLLQSNYSSWKAIGSCLKRTEESPSKDNYYNVPSKKAFIGGSVVSYGKDQFVSEDSFYIEMYGFVFSKTFCCSEHLDEIIHRTTAAGLFSKFSGDQLFFMEFIKRSSESSSVEITRRLNLHDLSGAFYILISGWLFAFVILLAEIFYEKMLCEK